jgi:hypothetical protein
MFNSQSVANTLQPNMMAKRLQKQTIEGSDPKASETQLEDINQAGRFGS